MTAVSRELRTRAVAAAAQAMACAGMLMPASKRLFDRFVEEFELTPEEACEAQPSGERRRVLGRAGPAGATAVWAEVRSVLRRWPDPVEAREVAARTGRLLELPGATIDRVVSLLGPAPVVPAEAASAAYRTLDEIVANGKMEDWVLAMAGPAGEARTAAAVILSRAGASDAVARGALRGGGLPVWLLEPAAASLWPEVSLKLTAALEEPAARVREQALRCLGILGPRAEAAAPAMTALLRDAEPNVRERALAALGDLGSGAAASVPAMVEAYRDRRVDFPDLARALRSLGAAAQAALPVLLEGLASQDGSHREAAAEALGEMGPAAASAAPGLATLLHDPAHGRPLGTDRFLRKPSLFERALAWAAGQEEEEPQAGEETRAVLEESRARSVRQSAARALGGLGPAAGEVAVRALAQALSDRDCYVKRNAAEALARLGDAAAAACPALLESLEDPEVREEALRTLAVVGAGTTGGQDALLWALDVPGLDQVTGTALAGAGHGELLLRWIRQRLQPSPDGQSVPDRAIRLLAELGSVARPLVPAVVAMLGAADEDRRRVAASTLGSLGPVAADAVPALLEALGTSSRYLRAEVVEALGRIGDSPQRVVPAIERLLGDPEPDVRRNAVEALGLFGPESRAAAGAIASAVADSSLGTRLAAIRALGRLGPDAAEAAPVLVEVLRDDSGGWTAEAPGVVELAEEALVAIGPAACSALLQALQKPGDCARVRVARTLLQLAEGS